MRYNFVLFVFPSSSTSVGDSLAFQDPHRSTIGVTNGDNAAEWRALQSFRGQGSSRRSDDAHGRLVLLPANQLPQTVNLFVLSYSGFALQGGTVAGSDRYALDSVSPIFRTATIV